MSSWAWRLSFSVGFVCPSDGGGPTPIGTNKGCSLGRDPDADTEPTLSLAGSLSLLATLQSFTTLPLLYSTTCTS